MRLTYALDGIKIKAYFGYRKYLWMLYCQYIEALNFIYSFDVIFVRSVSGKSGYSDKKEK